jgi:hypothetical protein
MNPLIGNQARAIALWVLLVGALALLGFSPSPSLAVEASAPVKRVKKVSIRFVEALADRDIRACHYLTRDGIEQIKIQADQPTCAKGIRAQDVLFERMLLGATPRQLTGDLELASIRRRDSSTEFRFPLAHRKGKVSLRLVKPGARLRVNSIIAGQVVTCYEGEPCPPPSP